MMNVRVSSDLDQRIDIESRCCSIPQIYGTALRSLGEKPSQIRE